MNNYCVRGDKLLGGKKKSLKHTNMGSSFKDLVATSLTVKTDFQSDINLFKYSHFYIKCECQHFRLIAHAWREGSRALESCRYHSN
jgi:hypothetical protein